MSYGYQDLYYDNHKYEHKEYGSHGDDGYNEYEPYSDQGAPDHWEPEPTPFEPDHYNHEYDNHGFEYEVPQYEVAGEDHEHRELAHDDEETGMEWEAGYEGEVDGYEHRELEDEGNKVCELRELEYEGDEEHEHGNLVYDNDERRELEELERMVNEEGYEPQGPYFGYNGTQEPPQPAYELGYSDDGASEYGDHENGNGYPYPPPPPTSVHA